jgi:Fe-S oxidoreductase
VETEFTIKSVVMAVLLMGAFGLFFVRVRRLVAIMKAVKGRTDVKADRLATRLRVLISDVLGQTNVRRKRWPGIAHTLIFFGFLAVQPHSLELMIRGVFPGFDISHLAPGLYGSYLYVADILAFFVLVGLGYALYRRLLERPGYLANGLDAKLIILFTAVIILSFHFINALQSLMPVPADGFDYAAGFPVSTGFVTFFSLGGLSISQVSTGYEIAYWIHMLTILGFLVYIPGSKHLHLLAAVPNVFLKPLEREKKMITTDIEDEEAESFGLGSVADLHWKNVLDLYACTECGRCQEQCPADATGKPLSPRRLVSDFKHDLFDQAEALLAGDASAVKPIVRDGSPVSGDVLWSCTTCRACEDICPVNIQHLDLILEARKNQVLMEAAFPPEMQETFTNLENQSNPWGFSADTRADWCHDLDVPLMTDHPEAELLYFVGCAGSFDDRGKKIARAMARVLKKAGVDFAILGPEEGCNGDVARRAGNEYLAQMLIQANVELLNGYKPKKILAGCPHCFNMLKNEYPGFGAAFPVVHHSEYLLDLLRQGRLTAGTNGLGKLTFHDSCYLGRWNGIFDVPGELLAALNNGAAPVMPQRRGDKGFCCGAGGARMFMEETIGERININRVRELMATGADTVAAACPFCITMLNDGITDCHGNMAVQDIAEIVDAATT